MKKIKPAVNRILILGIIFMIVTGFRIFSESSKWDISKSDPKVWLNFSEQMLPDDNDVSEGDWLYDQSFTFQNVVTSILQDFNNIPASYLTLADKDNDADFDPNLHSKRIIDIQLGTTTGASSGVASLDIEDGKVIGCNIVLSEDTLSSAKVFIGTLTHELGHCVGLDHPHETTHALMSYYHSEDEIRLMIDDIMGIIYLYPEDPDETTESPTFGLQCSPSG